MKKQDIAVKATQQVRYKKAYNDALAEVTALQIQLEQADRRARYYAHQLYSV